MRRNLIGKTLALGVVVLFIGVSVHPAFAVDTKTSITSNQNNVLVETTIEICKPDGNEKHSISLTQEQSSQLDILIDNFKTDLDNRKSLEEIIQIYEDMIVSLDSIGLFQDMNVENVKDFLINNQMDLKNNVNSLKRINKEGDVYENRECQISGQTYYTLFYSNLRVMFKELSEKFSGFLGSLFDALCVYLGLFQSISPIANGNAIMFGLKHWSPNPKDPYTFYYPAGGWLSTDGLYGNFTIDGTFWGHIAEYDNLFQSASFLGALGFKGIKLYRIRGTFYIGRVSHIKVGTDFPDFYP
jgi:hypothetical protein